MVTVRPVTGQEAEDFCGRDLVGVRLYLQLSDDPTQRLAERPHERSFQTSGYTAAEPFGALFMGAAVSVFLDEPFGVVSSLGEEADGLSDLVDGFEDAAMDDLLLERPEQAFDDAAGLGLADEGVAGGQADLISGRGRP